MIRARGEAGGIPCLANGKQRRGSKAKSKNRVAANATKGEAGVHGRQIEEARANLSHPGEIRRECGKFFCGMRAEAIR